MGPKIIPQAPFPSGGMVGCLGIEGGMSSFPIKTRDFWRQDASVDARRIKGKAKLDGAVGWSLDFKGILAAPPQSYVYP